MSPDRTRGRVTAAAAWVAAAVVVLSITGCSAEPVTDEASTHAASATSVGAEIVARAKEEGAGQDQLDLLEAGDISFATYQTAVTATISCIREAGIEVMGDEVTQPRGFPEIAYSYAVSSAGRTDDQTLAIADACILEHSQFIEQAYQMSPASLEAIEAAFEPYRQAAIACVLKHRGESLEADASASEVKSAASRLATSGGVDCLAQSGFRG